MAAMCTQVAMRPSRYVHTQVSVCARSLARVSIGLSQTSDKIESEEKFLNFTLIRMAKQNSIDWILEAIFSKLLSFALAL